MHSVPGETVSVYFPALDSQVLPNLSFVQPSGAQSGFGIAPRSSDDFIGLLWGTFHLLDLAIHSGELAFHDAALAPHLDKLRFNGASKDKQIAVISALAGGSSIRSIARMTGIHRDTSCD